MSSFAAEAAADPAFFVDAAACGDLGGVAELLGDKNTSAVLINCQDKDGRSALHYSCLNDDSKLLTMLLADKRVNVAQTTPKGDTCLHLAAVYASLEALKLLFADSRGKKLLDMKNDFGETAMHRCAGSGDKGACKAAQMLLEAGASLTIIDQWQRGPSDVATDNAYNGLVKIIADFIADKPDVLKQVAATTAEFMKTKDVKPEISEAAKTERAKVFGGLGSAIGGALKGLRKVSISEKTMFAKSSGIVSKGVKKDAKSSGKVLSKLIDFPGDRVEIAAHLKDNKTVSAGGKDAYGLTALHKFASWNKVEFIEMLLPHLSKDDVNMQDPDGKTALHWACEMASVGSVTTLMACEHMDSSLKDNKGRTALDIVKSGSGSIIKRLRAALGDK